MIPSDQNQENKENPVKKRHYGKIVAAIFFILALVFTFIFYKISQKPVEGVIKLKSENNEIIQEKNDIPEVFSGKYVSFMYPNQYVIKSHETNEVGDNIILETAYLSETKSVSKKINLTVRNINGQNLEDVPDYKMREINSGRYKKEYFSEGKISGVSFVPADDSQFEKTFFIKNGDFLAIISVQAASLPDEGLNKEADAIVKSLEWVKK